MQTKGLKRHFQEELHPEKFKVKNDIVKEPGQKKINIISGAKRRRLLHDSTVPEKKASINDPNVVGFDSDSDETNNDDSDEDTVDVNNKEEVIEEILEADTADKGDVILNEKKPEIIEIKDTKEETVNIKVDRKPAVFVDVIRSEEIQVARMKLPILAEEQQIMEVINENTIIIIAGNKIF